MHIHEPNHRMYECTENKEAREKYQTAILGEPFIPSFASSNAWFR